MGSDITAQMSAKFLIEDIEHQVTAFIIGKRLTGLMQALDKFLLKLLEPLLGLFRDLVSGILNVAR